MRLRRGRCIGSQIKRIIFHNTWYSIDSVYAVATISRVSRRLRRRQRIIWYYSPCFGFHGDFRNAHADLWAFGHRKRKSARLRFGLDAFETFQEREYKQMLLLHTLHDIPLLYSDDVIEYKLGNRTVASLWPYLDTWPESGEDALSWYKVSGGHVVTLHL